MFQMTVESSVKLHDNEEHILRTISEIAKARLRVVLTRGQSKIHCLRLKLPMRPTQASTLGILGF